VIFGLYGKAIFPQYYDQVEEVVMAHAYELSTNLEGGKTSSARKKLDLIREMFARATSAGRASRI
jgi:hypothetical protein